MRRLTPLDSRQRRGNYVPTPSSVSTTKIIIKLIQMNVPSGSTDSTKNGIWKNTIKIFSQNIWKNYLIVNIILKTKFEFNIIFVQEPSWTTICSVPSSRNCKGNELVGVPNHLNWLIFSKNPTVNSDFPRVVTYINIRLLSLYFLLRKDILNHRDILLISFFNNNKLFFFMNIYSDSSQSALKYLKNIEINIQNLLVMTRDFNIRDNLWDSLYPYYFSLILVFLFLLTKFQLDILTIFKRLIQSLILCFCSLVQVKWTIIQFIMIGDSLQIIHL